jgi:hypothetical protein
MLILAGGGRGVPLDHTELEHCYKPANGNAGLWRAAIVPLVCRDHGTGKPGRAISIHLNSGDH